ncbi:hypothetical protein TNCV_2364981 [Trichonephila clavipes]|nr:hypothetical protein TNCV_2364981 [Trichonephila clavipes]
MGLKMKFQTSGQLARNLEIQSLDQFIKVALQRNPRAIGDRPYNFELRSNEEESSLAPRFEATSRQKQCLQRIRNPFGCSSHEFLLNS